MVLFHFGQVEGVPEGVVLKDTAGTRPLDQDLLARTDASCIADIWRLHLMQRSDFVWIDTDAYCWSEVSLEDGDLVGWYHGRHQVNTGVLRAPRDSPAVRLVLDWFADRDFVPDWIRPVKRRKLGGMSHRKRLVEAFRLRRSVAGFFALTPAPNASGEIAHVQDDDVLHPIPLELGDGYFNPHGGWEGWVTPRTMMRHVFPSALRGRQRKWNDAKPGSLMHRLIGLHAAEARLGSARVAPASGDATAASAA